MKIAQYYKAAEDSTVQCQLCHHFCRIKDNQTGICKVRLNNNGQLFSLVYGFPVAVNPDPIEKKPFFHFMPGSLTYSLGTMGCNFACANCQNWDISQVKNIKRKIENLPYIAPEKIIENALGENCDSIAYTYNEPTVFTEYALDIMRQAHSRGLKNVWVSNGFMSTVCLESILPFLDAINIDLKAFNESFYKRNCQASLLPVLENLKLIKNEDIHLEITTLLIPSLNDNIEDIKKIAEFIVTELDTDTPWHISKFSPQISWSLRDLASTSEDMIYGAYEIGKEAGIKYIYAGNMPGDQKENTYCPACGALVISRLGYQIERNDENGLCPNCEKNLDIIV